MKMILKSVFLSSIFLMTPVLAASSSSGLNNDTDKLSYTIGNELGASFKKHNQALNPAAVEQGVADGMNGAPSKLSDQQKQQVMSDYQQRMLAQAQQQNAKAATSDATAGQAFLAANAKKPGVKVTQSGLQYQIITQGAGAKPSAQDVVTVDYEGKLIDGTVFDSSYKRGTPAEFPVNQVIAGWTEALQMMPVGSTWMLYIPGNLAYGAQGMPPAGIGPNAVLVFKVHLISSKSS